MILTIEFSIHVMYYALALCCVLVYLFTIEGLDLRHSNEEMTCTCNKSVQHVPFKSTPCISPYYRQTTWPSGVDSDSGLLH